MAECYVWARCNTGMRKNEGFDLQLEFSGSRKECNDYVKNKARQGGATHFLEVTALNYDAAFEKFRP